MAHPVLRARARRTLFAITAIVLGVAVARAQQATPPRWHGTIDLTIGGEVADDDATFGSVSGLASDAAGRIYVADRQDHQIRVFSPTGTLVTRLGRMGSGPLEFKRLATIVIGPDRLLWARDEGNARMLAFDVSQIPFRNVHTVPLTQFTGGSQLPITFEPDGTLVDETTLHDKTIDGFRPLRLRRAMNGDVTRTDTLAIPAGAFAAVHKVSQIQKDKAGREIGFAQSYVSQPYGAGWLRAYGPGGVRAEAMSSRYEIRIIAADGRLVRTLRRTVAPVPLSARERTVGEKSLQADVTALRLKRSSLPFGVPALKPPISQMMWTLDGQLWVERAIADGRPHEADVYDTNGRWIAVAEWPSAIDPYASRVAITGPTMVTVVRDSSDVESVVRLRFR